MHCVLDMDGTLLSSDVCERVYARPNLPDFLSFLFARFESVSIWTAARDDWFHLCWNAVIRDAMPPNQEFRFVWTRRHCQFRREYYGNDILVEKPLEKLYRCFPDMNSSNTFIVDDTPSTYCHNPNNAIYIPTFNHNFPADTGLINLIHLLSITDHLLPIIDEDSEDDEYLGTPLILSSSFY